VAEFLELLLLALAMGLSIFLSMPLVLRRSERGSTLALLNAAAIGILLFLLADVFSDVAGLNAGSALYLTIPLYDIVFVVAVAGAFLLLLVAERRGGGSAPATPTTLATVIALAIGFQNLTEGLVFGAAWSAGEVGLLTVVFVGFFLQNVTEGFPIASPFLGTGERRIGRISALFALGGLPTFVGAAIGYFYNSRLLVILFDALAIGAILYALLPMLRGALRPAATPELTAMKMRLTYAGLLLGFLLGFVVNAF
jgi:zinc transporter, ZIP family